MTIDVTYVYHRNLHISATTPAAVRKTSHPSSVLGVVLGGRHSGSMLMGELIVDSWRHYIIPTGVSVIEAN